ncbi:hypothetical protein JJV70_10540 [Streptomyces sp. JJ66]|uniref:hypothetical protein n=1 Tax=Streptomyces sp. JJ66 TaxID=2803843 RepID=UPI001C5747C1|nr:hypothetical protein [Streptomyces sp. JJ66]MBW1602537.1 hypothetical protein [Streptomyces sp. JJ66]
MTDEDSGYEPLVREVESVREGARKVSSELLDIIALQGKVSEPGPGVGLCGERDPDTFYTISHPWSLTEVPVPQMEQAMQRLYEELPKRGWEIISYGPAESEARSLTLIADYNEGDKRFSVNAQLRDSRNKGANANASRILVTVVSACYQVPEGQVVEGY